MPAKRLCQLDPKNWTPGGWVRHVGLGLLARVGALVSVPDRLCGRHHHHPAQCGLGMAGGAMSAWPFWIWWPTPGSSWPFSSIGRINLQLRAVVSVVFIYLIGLGVLAQVGPVSGGMAWLFTFALMAAILLGRVAAAIAIVMNAFTIGGIYWAGTEDLMPWSSLVHDQADNWLVANLNYLVLNALVASGVAALLGGPGKPEDQAEREKRPITGRDRGSPSQRAGPWPRPTTASPPSWTAWTRWSMSRISLPTD